MPLKLSRPSRSFEGMPRTSASLFVWIGGLEVWGGFPFQSKPTSGMPMISFPLVGGVDSWFG